ncbi:hypothetical protein [Sphingomonas sp. SRS2]|uniref:hypothetical protein n=1 Tax=Sphingomonas sp. SRS2 TaxID=133190 RepID=UPI0006184B2B|nr:hypothetical protein [Sphingomonas sp. SRS2]KKC25329.1 hypothetical protein WP12_14860 [Sphingomonas sp. SRS2]
MTEATILIDADSATVEKRNIAFSAIVDDDTLKFNLSIADFQQFGVENAKADPVGSVAAISRNLEDLIQIKARKNELLPTTKLAPL